MKKFEAVILDIDGTLSSEVSWYALTQGLGASAVEHKAIYEAYRSGKITYEDSKQQLIGLWRATGNANRKYIDGLFKSWELYPDVEQTVKEMRHAGYQICIITGSFDIWAKVVAQRLGVKYWFANTEIVWDQAGNLVDMHYELNQSKKKLEQLKGFCNELHIKPDKCLAVGDSENDVDLFTHTGNGIAVGENIDEVLAQKAWRVAQSFSEIQALLSTE